MQKILTPVWNYPDYTDQVDDVVAEFNSLPQNSVEVLFLGASHVGYGILPMDLYRERGIVTYNGGTSGQGLDSSLMFMLEAFKKQNPKLVVLDVSLIDKNPRTRGDKNKLRDNIPFGRNKVRFALADGNGKEIRYNLKHLPERWTKLVPFYEYHSRWKSLSRSSFTRFLPRKFFLLGYNAFSFINPFDRWDTEDEVAQRMVARNVAHSREYNDGVYGEAWSDEKALYAPFVYDGARRYISVMKYECERRGAKLLLIKVPAANYPQYYSASWTLPKHNMAAQLAAELELPFFDLKYDVDIGMDWSEDTVDWGGHLNLLGARKVTPALGEYLAAHYPLEARQVPEIDAKFPLYDDLMWLADLQLERDFSAYMERLKGSPRNLALFFSVADTAFFEATDDEKRALSEFGFRTDFYSAGYADSFLAVVDSGAVRFERLSNREQAYAYQIDRKHSVGMWSSGWETKSRASIVFSAAGKSTEYALNWRGLNIVVYDKESGLVLDSVCFDFWDTENRRARRDNGRTKDLFLTYERYLTERR